MDTQEMIQNALAKNPDAERVFNSLPPSHKKEYIQWVESAKKEETKQRRIAKMIDMLLKKEE